MRIISGHAVAERLWEGPRITTFRGQRIEDGRAVLLSLPSAPYPPLQDLSRLRQAFELTRSLDLPGVLRALALVKSPQGLVLVQENFGGRPLRAFMAGGPVDVETFLRIALQLADTVGALHQRQIIHKNLTPDSILFDPATGHVKLTGFEAASRLSTDSQTAGSPGMLEGNLVYLSPEQTGRMNRAVDYRTDFYSLGVTFYEMLTGAPPFASADPMELVHCHIARAPVPPHQRQAGIPRAVSRILLKLLAKTAEDRYKSALGLKADLEACLAQWQATGSVEDFEPGRHDVSDRFQIPQKLYGREAEIAALMAAFDRVSAGATELMLVYGYSGIGKSTLVHEIHKPIVRQRGYFVSGKFDQFKRDLPYSSLVQAFQELVRQLLTEGRDQLAAWKARLLEALGSAGQVLIDVLPEMELIIGPQPPLPPLGPTEAQNRFRLVFQKFITVFARREHPLVVFLDDLQWADPASLSLIQVLTTDPDSAYLLLIGAYRDNEVSAAHPLMLTLEKVKKAGTAVSEIALKPLERAHLDRLLSETMSSTEALVEPLAELVHHKTHGNPFFVLEFLKALHKKGLLRFDGALRDRQGGWRWDLEQIRAAQITDNVVDLMVGKIQTLGESTQDVLKLAACIGHRFDARTLSVVYEHSQAETAAALWDALQEGLIRPLDEGYKVLQLSEADDEPARPDAREAPTATYAFLHDRIQHAAYSLIPEDRKKEVHLRIGRLMLQHHGGAVPDEAVFEVANHLNYGADLLPDPEAREALAHLNLRAGRSAKKATAYEAALQYLRAGTALLDAASWQAHYDLTYALHLERAECEYLATQFAQAEKLFDVILAEARSTLDKVAVYTTRVRLLQHVGKELESIEVGLAGLRLLGLDFSTRPGKPALLRGLLQVSLSQRRRPVEDLLRLPNAMPPAQRAAMDLMMHLWGATFWLNQELNGLLVLHMVHLSLRWGHAEASSVAYVCYGVFKSAVLGDVATGARWGNLAVALANRAGNPFLQAKVTFISTSFFAHFRRPVRETVGLFKEGLKDSLESGDFIYAGYCANMIAWIMAPAGFPLEEVVAQVRKLLDTARRIENRQCVVSLQIIERWAAVLSGAAPLSPGERPAFEVDIFRGEEGQFEMELGAYRLFEVQLLYLFGHYREALEKARQLKGNTITEPTGAYLVSYYHLFYGLTLAALYPTATPQEQKTYRKLLRQQRRALKKYADQHAGNFLHKYLLVSAELARISGADDAAADLYNRAIASAQENEFVQNAALAHELAGRFHLERDSPRLAAKHLMEARYGYFQWGAHAKTRALEQAYPDLLSQAAREAPAERPAPPASPEALDLRTVLKASQAISSEIVLDRLLVKLMRILLENAGAQKGFLILRKDEQLVIEAEGSLDRDDVTVLQSAPVDTSADLSPAIIHYVARTRESVVLNDALQEGLFTADPYMLRNRPKSILCAPLLNQGNLTGILYLENNLTTSAFTPERLELLRLLSAAIAISIEKARLYRTLEVAHAKLADYSQTLERRVAERTAELERSLSDLKVAQARLIQSEKMASLGQMTAGVAHEIKNPLNFIINFAQLSAELLAEVAGETRAQPDLRAADLEPVLADLQMHAEKILEHGRRADGIVRSMLDHSRNTKGERLPTDLNALLEEHVNLAYHGMCSAAPGFACSIERDYDPALRQMEVVPQELGRVFMNLLNNAFYAVHEQRRRHDGFRPQVTVRTRDLGGSVEVCVEDNGPGIPAEMKARIFEPFFTTKPTGQGTGLGLSLSYDIVAHGYGGSLEEQGRQGEGARFVCTLPVPRPLARLTADTASPTA